MKLFIVAIALISTLLNAGVEVTQNMRALYKGVDLTAGQENYILDHQASIIKVFEVTLKKESKHLGNQTYHDERNVISFTLNPDLSINDFKFLSRSSERILDNTTKNAIYGGIEKFPMPKESTVMRFIITYNLGTQNTQNYSYENQPRKQSETKERYQNIAKGTTRFQHSMKEYIREFETSEDGFINYKTEPDGCMKKLSLLTKDNQNVSVGYNPSRYINVEIPKGKYKLLFNTNKTCDIQLQYK